MAVVNFIFLCWFKIDLTKRREDERGRDERLALNWLKKNVDSMGPASSEAQATQSEN
jgi:hypothetical protein